MITKAEWNQLDDQEKYDYVIYMQGQIEGLIKSLRLVAPRQKPLIEPQENKFANIQSVDEWLFSKSESSNQS